MIQLNHGLSVWQKKKKKKKPKDFFHQILSFLWKGHNDNKTVTNKNHTEPKQTKTVIWKRAMTCAIFEFLRQFASGYVHFLQNSIDKFKGVQHPRAIFLKTMYCHKK